MGSLHNDQKEQNVSTSMEQSDSQVAVIMVPFPAQGHLNQLIQLSCLILSYGIPVHYIGSAIHNRQARLRINGLNPFDVAKINFHDIPTSPFVSPPPNPNTSNKFPAQLQPAWDATFSQRQPVADFLQDMSSKARRVVVIHGPLMAYVVQDAAFIPNAESYCFNCISAFAQLALAWEGMGKPLPIEFPKGISLAEGFIEDEINYFWSLQFEPLKHSAGDIYNTCRSIEALYLDLLSSEEIAGNRKSWAIGPILPAKLPSPHRSPHKCLEWLDKQEPKSVIYVTFGTATSLSDEEIRELAWGLEQSKQKFIWVLRDADKGDVFNGEIRRVELP